MSTDEFSPATINYLVIRLAKKLTDIGIDGCISIVGGAAMAIKYFPARPATTDIDAVYPREPDVLEIIDSIMIDESLKPGWINSAAAVFLPEKENNIWDDYLQVGSIKIRTAKPELLLAMKVLADRGDRDRQDIEKLLTTCKIENLEQIFEIVGSYYPHALIQEKTTIALMEMLGH